uniref:Uncharacterized protein n=1 Tax=Pseudictyota dubia TaxID=2749911 RepID=A0A7R9W1R8_9STRA
MYDITPTSAKIWPGPPPIFRLIVFFTPPLWVVDSEKTIIRFRGEIILLASAKAATTCIVEFQMEATFYSSTNRERAHHGLVRFGKKCAETTLVRRQHKDFAVLNNVDLCQAGRTR